MSRAMKPSGIEWIGEIPEGWEIVRLKNIALLNPFNNKSFEDGTMISFSPMEYIGQGKMDTLAIEIEKVKNGYTFFANDDVIMAKVTPCFENGNIAIAKNLLNGVGYGSSELYVFRCTKASNIFLFYFLQNNTFKNKCTTSMYGAGGLKRVPLDCIKSYKLALPPLSEQQAIADYLDRKCELIESTIEKQKTAIEKLKLYKQSVITEAVTKGLDPTVPMKPSGIEWIGEVPNHWGIVKLKKITHRITKGTTPTTIGKEFTNDGILFLKVESLSDNMTIINEMCAYIDSTTHNILSRSSINENDVLISIAGAIGRTVIVKKENLPANTNQAISIISPNIKILNPLWLGYTTYSSYFTSNLKIDTVQTAQLNVSLGNLSNSIILLPPLPEQQAIADYLDQKCSQIDQSIELKQKLIEKLSSYKKSLIYECVTGKREVGAS